MRRYDEPVEVRRGVHSGVVSVAVNGAEPPDQFLWRRRVYTVREVLAHWLESGPWWRSRAAEGVHGLDTGGPPGGDSRGGAAGVPATVLEDVERDVWRVEAIAGRLAGPTVVDLAYDWTEAQWRLVCTYD